MHDTKTIEEAIKNALVGTITPPEFIILGVQDKVKYSFLMLDTTGVNWWNNPEELGKASYDCNPDKFLDTLINAYCKVPKIISTILPNKGIIIFNDVAQIQNYLDDLTIGLPPQAVLDRLEHRPYITLSKLETPYNKILPHKNAVRNKLPPEIQIF